MKEYFADLHIHIGKAKNGKSIKITASSNLTFENIILECLNRKGIDIIGIVDSASPSVIKDIKELIKEGFLYEDKDGGLRHKDDITILLASEVETREENGGFAHHLVFFPYLKQVIEFSNIMKDYIKNIDLSSQRARLRARDLYVIASSIGGVLIPAHVFTPHKSLYGNSASSLKDVFLDTHKDIFSIELGLSADTYLADYLPELKDRVFLSNSDAHSLQKIAREYNKFLLQKPTFKEVMLALKKRENRKVLANYGLDPNLGKYHRTFCIDCNQVKDYIPAPVLSCDKDKNHKIVKGVKDRILEISPTEFSNSPSDRPPYFYQVPLEYVPGLGPRMMDKLILNFATEMNVLHKATYDDLKSVVGSKIAELIILAREGKLKLKSGGGGKYGKVDLDKAKKQMTLFN